MGHSLKYVNRGAMDVPENNILDNMTMLFSSLTHFEIGLVLLHHVATYVIHSFLLLYSKFNSNVFLYSLQMINNGDR